MLRSYKSVWPKITKAEQAWRQSLSSIQEIVIEIGAGVGYHPLQYSQANPDKFVVAIERTKEKYNSFAQRYQHHPQCTNLYPVHADAIKWIDQNIVAGEVDAYFILYPNPYPKESQKNKRFAHMPFLTYLLETLKPNGIITLATNENFYYQEFKATLVEHFELQVLTDEVLHLSKLPANFQPRTHFEKKYLARGENCFNLVLGKEG